MNALYDQIANRLNELGVPGPSVIPEELNQLILAFSRGESILVVQDCSTGGIDVWFSEIKPSKFQTVGHFGIH